MSKRQQSQQQRSQQQQMMMMYGGGGGNEPWLGANQLMMMQQQQQGYTDSHHYYPSQQAAMYGAGSPYPPPPPQQPAYVQPTETPVAELQGRIKGLREKLELCEKERTRVVTQIFGLMMHTRDHPKDETMFTAVQLLALFAKYGSCDAPGRRTFTAVEMDALQSRVQEQFDELSARYRGRIAGLIASVHNLVEAAGPKQVRDAGTSCSPAAEQVDAGTNPMEEEEENGASAVEELKRTISEGEGRIKGLEAEIDALKASAEAEERVHRSQVEDLLRQQQQLVAFCRGMQQAPAAQTVVTLEQAVRAIVQETTQAKEQHDAMRQAHEEEVTLLMGNAAAADERARAAKELNDALKRDIAALRAAQKKHAPAIEAAKAREAGLARQNADLKRAVDEKEALAAGYLQRIEAMEEARRAEAAANKLKTFKTRGTNPMPAARRMDRETNTTAIATEEAAPSSSSCCEKCVGTDPVVVEEDAPPAPASPSLEEVEELRAKVTSLDKSLKKALDKLKIKEARKETFDENAYGVYEFDFDSVRRTLELDRRRQERSVAEVRQENLDLKTKVNEQRVQIMELVNTWHQLTAAKGECGDVEGKLFETYAECCSSPSANLSADTVRFLQQQADEGGDAGQERLMSKIFGAVDESEHDQMLKTVVLSMKLLSSLDAESKFSQRHVMKVLHRLRDRKLEDIDAEQVIDVIATFVMIAAAASVRLLQKSEVLVDTRERIPHFIFTGHLMVGEWFRRAEPKVDFKTCLMELQKVSLFKDVRITDTKASCREVTQAVGRLLDVFYKSNTNALAKGGEQFRASLIVINKPSVEAHVRAQDRRKAGRAANYAKK